MLLGFFHKLLILSKFVKVVFNVLIHFTENLVHLPLGFKVTNFTVELGFAHKESLAILFHLVVGAEPEVEFLSILALGLFSFFVRGQDVVLVYPIINTDVLRSL